MPVVSGHGIQLVVKRVDKLKAPKSPAKKRDVMRVLGCLCFYSSYIKNLHIDSKPFFHLTRDDTPFEWTPELFNAIEERFTRDTILAIPNENDPFHIHVDSSSVGTVSILVFSSCLKRKKLFPSFPQSPKKATKNFDASS